MCDRLGKGWHVNELLWNAVGKINFFSAVRAQKYDRKRKQVEDASSFI